MTLDSIKFPALCLAALLVGSCSGAEFKSGEAEQGIAADDTPPDSQPNEGAGNSSGVDADDTPAGGDGPMEAPAASGGNSPGAFGGTGSAPGNPPATGGRGGTEPGAGGAGAGGGAPAGGSPSVCDVTKCPDAECAPGSAPFIPAGECCEQCRPVECGPGSSPCSLLDCAEATEVSPGCCTCGPVTCEPGYESCDTINCAPAEEGSPGCCRCAVVVPECGKDEAASIEHTSSLLLASRENWCEEDSDCERVDVTTACGNECPTSVRDDFRDEYTERLKAIGEDICSGKCTPWQRPCDRAVLMPRCVQRRCR